MKNIITSFSIFALLVVSIFFSIHYLNTSNGKLKVKTETLENSISDKKWDSAYNESLSLMNDWDKHSDIISLFTDHLEIDNVNSEIWKLTQYTKCKNLDESLASVHNIKFMLKHIKDLEKVNIKNVF